MFLVDFNICRNKQVGKFKLKLGLFFLCLSSCNWQSYILQKLDSSFSEATSVSVSTTSQSSAESTTLVSVDVTLNSVATNQVVVNYSLSGTATGTDYIDSSGGSITINAGQTSGQIQFTVIDDSDGEPSETIVVTLSSATNASVTAPSAQTVTIIDNDTFTVQSVYPINGQNWNDYIKFDNIPSGSGHHDQSDTACDTSETGYYDGLLGCIHGGEKKKVTLASYSSCANLTAEDFLNVFDWICKLEFGTVTFYSKGLKKGKGLSDLVNSSSWKNNHVIIKQSGQTIALTTNQIWWTNPVVVLPDNSAESFLTLDNVDDDAVGPDAVFTPGTIFTVNANQATPGYAFNLDKFGLVTLGNSTLTRNNNATNNCNWNTGETAAALARVILCVGSQNFFWIEGSYAGIANSANEGGLYLILSKFFRLNNLQVTRSQYEIVYLLNSSQSLLTNLNLAHTTGDWGLLDFSASHRNKVFGLRITDSKAGANGDGLVLQQNSDNNIFHELTIANTDTAGIYLRGGNDNIFTDLVFSATGNHAVRLESSSSNASRNTFSHITTANVSRSAFHIEANPNLVNSTVVNQLLSANNGTFSTVSLYSAHNTVLSQLYMSHNTTWGFLFSASDNTKLTNNVFVGNTAGCDVTGGVNPGLIDDTCALQGASDANFVNDNGLVDLSNSFVGKVTSDVNSSDTVGTSIYSSITDFFNYDNRFRTWGNDTGTFPAIGLRGRCTGADTCRIWDWRLSSLDTKSRNKSLDGANPNAAFTPGGICPAAVHGNRAITNNNTVPSTFLINALEIIGDQLGNDNGLCESSESCIYSPNFGAYQGSGDYRSQNSCVFQNGTVTNVIMYAYPTNGE